MSVISNSNEVTFDQKYLNFVIQMSLSFLIIVVQQLLIKIIQGNYEYNNLDKYTLILVSSLVLISMFKLPQLNFEYVNMQNSSILERITMSRIITPAILELKDSQSKEYSIHKILEASSQIELIELAIMYPKNFIDDVISLLTYQIILSIKNFVNVINLNKLSKLIPINTLRLLEQKVTNVCEYKKFVNKICQVQFNYICQLILIDQDQIINQSYLEIEIKKVKEVYLKIKFDKLNNKIKCCDLRQLPSFKSSETLISINNLNLVNMNSNNNFENSQYFKLARKINQKFSQDINSDLILSKLYQNNISEDRMNNINQKDFSFETKQIWELLERKLNIKTIYQAEQFNFNEKKDKHCSIEDLSLNFFTRIAVDKSIERINTKIYSKMDKIKTISVPYFQNFVKDIKRLTLIFEKENDLQKFYQYLKRFFGHDFQNNLELDTNISVRVKEFKNNFNQTANDQNDLKFIIEVSSSKINIQFTIEVQCNIEYNICWKDADHLFYEINRLNENIYQQGIEESYYDQYESKHRKYINILINFLTPLLYIIILFVFFQSYTDQDSQNKKYILCYNGDILCYDLCKSNQIEKSICLDQFTSFYNQIELKERFKFCSDHQQQDYEEGTFDIRVFEACKDIMIVSDISLTIGIDQCYQIPNNLIQCPYNMKLTNLLKHQDKFDSINTELDSFVIYHQNKLVNYKINQFRYKNNGIFNFIEDVDNIASIKMNVENICAHTHNNELFCSVNDTFKVLSYSQTQSHSCIIYTSTFTICTGSNIFGQINIPFTNIYNNSIINCSYKNTCILTLSYELICIGDIEQVYNQVPSDNLHSITSFSMKDYTICMIYLDNKLSCFSNSTYGQGVIPNEQINEEFFKVSTGDNGTCALLMGMQVICFGNMVHNGWKDHSIAVDVNFGQYSYVIQIDQENSYLYSSYNKSYQTNFINIQVVELVPEDHVLFVCGINTQGLGAAGQITLENSYHLQNMSFDHRVLSCNKQGMSQDRVYVQLSTDRYLYLIDETNKNLHNIYPGYSLDLQGIIEYDIESFNIIQKDNTKQQNQSFQDNIQVDKLQDVYLICDLQSRDKIQILNSNKSEIIDQNYIQNSEVSRQERAGDEVVDLQCSNIGQCALQASRQLQCFGNIIVNIETKYQNKIHKFRLHEYYLCIITIDYKQICSNEYGTLGTIDEQLSFD